MTSLYLFLLQFLNFLAFSPSLPQGDATLSEEEQILRAIALSLGQDTEGEREKEREEKEREKKRQEEEERRRKEEELLRPLDKTALDDFSNELLEGCIELTSSVAESVCQICDLVSALTRRNGAEWRSRTLDKIKTQVCLEHALFISCRCTCALEAGPPRDGKALDATSDIISIGIVVYCRLKLLVNSLFCHHRMLRVAVVTGMWVYSIPNDILFLFCFPLL